MKHLKHFLVFSLGLYLVGCGTAAKNYGYMQGREYQNRQQLAQGLFGPNDKLSESAIQKVLNSKVKLPPKVNLAVVRLSDDRNGLSFQTIDKDLETHFFDKKNWGNRVQSIIPMPEVMIAQPVTLASLRQAAALLQADALVIIRPMSQTNWKFQMLTPNLAKAITTLEVLVLDTRTSVVPFTSIITETSEVAKQQTDFDNYEFKKRAQKTSEKQALIKVAPEVKKFISIAL